MSDFLKFGLPDAILDTLKHLNFTVPTPIQEQSLPFSLAGRDVLGSAQTGTGKTAAFAIPMINHIRKTEGTAALILLPTRELAIQVSDAVQGILGKTCKIRPVLLIGGVSMSAQIQKLQGNKRIIIGTPGRINDHLGRRTLNLSRTDFLVLDEMDRMLDLGFKSQLEKIVKFLPEKRQTLMFSATLPENILALSKQYLTDPVRVAVGSTTAVAPNVRQEIIKTDDGNKFTELLEQLNAHEGSSLVFVKTKYGTEKLAKKLEKEGQTASAIHGDLRQNRRERVIEDFRSCKMRILVATDIAARGLDIPHIESVINYDLPQCPEDYIHRIGRTARAGESGVAINLLTPKDGDKWKAICKLLQNKKKDASEHEVRPLKKKCASEFEKKSGKNFKEKRSLKNRNVPTFVRAAKPAVRKIKIPA